jgi:hypothetical protein
MNKGVYTELSAAERQKLSLSLMQLGGPDTFVVALDKEFSSEDEPEPVSILWDCERALQPNRTTLEQLKHMMIYIQGHAKWSRLALARALSASHRTPLANEIWPSWRQGEAGVAPAQPAAVAAPSSPSAPSLEDLAEIPPQVDWQHYIPALGALPASPVRDLDLEPLLFKDRVTCATAIVRMGGTLAFLTLANGSYASPGQPNQISNMFAEITSQHPHDSQVEVLVRLIERMGGLQRWSRRHFMDMMEIWL